jgi:hypothetical protein
MIKISDDAMQRMLTTTRIFAWNLKVGPKRNKGYLAFPRR